MRDREDARWLRSVPALDRIDLPTPRDAETASSILPGAPRVEALDALLREVDDLRLTLETDLSLAATAVEAGGTQAAIDILDDDLVSLERFEQSALGHLAELSVPAGRRGGRHLLARLSAAPFVAAAALVGLVIAAVPTDNTPVDHAISSVSAQSSLQQLTTLAAQGRTSEVREAALTLHDQINALVQTAPDNPVAAQQALLLLSYERNVIVQSGDSAALRDVLVLSAALAARIRSALPSALRTAVPVVPTVPLLIPAPERQQQATRQPKPSATPSASASSKATPKASPSAKTTQSPKSGTKPSPSPSASPGFLPYSSPYFTH